jgi:hypothetical protein
MSDWFDPLSESHHGTPIEDTTPTGRRRDGMLDARHRGIRMSCDKDYLGGYEYAENLLKRQAEAKETEAGTAGGS